MQDTLIKEIYTKAEKGDAQAQYQLGVLHYYGNGVAQDRKVAEQWFRKAAAQGHTLAQDRLRAMHAKGRDVKLKLCNNPKCGRENREEAQFCGYCRNPFTVATPSTTHRGLSLDDISKLTWDEFEKYAALVFRDTGYEVEGTPPGAPFADLIMKRNGKIIAIQIKHSQSRKRIGVSAVSAIISGKIHWEATEGWVVTNSVFTRGAKNLAQRANVRLINGDMLIKKHF